MSEAKLKPLIIGDRKIRIPFIQGGMGVRVTTAPLVGAVANCDCAGTLASVGLGSLSGERNTDFVKESRQGLLEQIDKVRQLTQGVVGVNILVALSNYDDLARTAASQGIDFIISGAGLPLRLPEYAERPSVALIPIVSSGRAAGIILKTWKKRYNRIPGAIVVEGPLAGGHLGFSLEEASSSRKGMLEELVIEVLKVVEGYQQQFSARIPVIAAGGIFNGKDIAHFLNLGAQGVQMATRFVATVECTMSDRFKEMYLGAQQEDIAIIKSPVGLPGRVVKTKFIDELQRNDRKPVSCHYKCLKTCDPKTAPYCIAKALLNATKEESIDDSIVFAGANVARVNRITTVKELIGELVFEANQALQSS